VVALAAACGSHSTGFTQIDDSPPPALASDTLPIDTSFAPELRPEAIRADAPEREDCNGNGLADFIDLREGTEDDANENRIPDPCESDSNLLAHPQNTRWQLYALAADTSFFWTGYQRLARAEGGEVVAIRYTVPRGGAAVRLDVFDAHGVDLATLVNERQRSGAYETVWHRDRAGKAVPPGMYRLRLEVNGRVTVRRARWAQ
jgi:hypothetical protein